MKRRSLIAGILSAGFAPAAIGAGVLMPIRRVWTPIYMRDAQQMAAWGDAVLPSKLTFGLDDMPQWDAVNLLADRAGYRYIASHEQIDTSCTDLANFCLRRGLVRH